MAHRRREGWFRPGGRRAPGRRLGARRRAERRRRGRCGPNTSTSTGLAGQAAGPPGRSAPRSVGGADRGHAGGVGASAADGRRAAPAGPGRRRGGGTGRGDGRRVAARCWRPGRPAASASAADPRSGSWSTAEPGSPCRRGRESAPPAAGAERSTRRRWRSRLAVGATTRDSRPAAATASAPEPPARRWRRPRPASTTRRRPGPTARDRAVGDGGAVGSPAAPDPGRPEPWPGRSAHHVHLYLVAVSAGRGPRSPAAAVRPDPRAPPVARPSPATSAGSGRVGVGAVESQAARSRSSTSGTGHGRAPSGSGSGEGGSWGACFDAGTGGWVPRTGDPVREGSGRCSPVSSRRCPARARRPRAMRERTVPGGISSTSAISA